MTKWRFVYLGSVVTAAVIGVGLWTPLKQAVAKDPNKAPRFKVDPFWPKPLPNRWGMQQVTGISVDQNDHIWSLGSVIVQFSSNVL